MTTKQTLSHAELVRQRRAQQSRKRLKQTTQRAYHPEAVYRVVEPRLVLKPNAYDVPRAVSTGRKIKGTMRRQHYDVAFSVADRHVHTPGIAIPQFGSRWITGLLTIALVFVVYTLLTSPTFRISSGEIIGLQRLDPVEINNALHLNDQPIFMVVPAQIVANLRNNYPDLSSVDVHLGLPNRIIITVTERTPVIAWYQGNALAWIDRDGIVFPPRGSVEGLINVQSFGSPPSMEVDPATTPSFVRPFLTPEMVRAICSLNPYVPVGMPMIYDPSYGLGWEDGRGWSVYFGNNTNNILMKLQVYEALVDKFAHEGVQTSLISVEYLGAPFYK